MFGKHFASMYSGSMFGKPAIVFAVLGYVIANMRPSRKDGKCYVELNPTLLAATFSSPVEEVVEAIRGLTEPDPRSRTADYEGRRLLPQGSDSIGDGPMLFVVVNGAKYRALRDEEERRVYLREKKREERRLSTSLLTVNRRQPPSTQAEAEAEAEERTTYNGMQPSAARRTPDERRTKAVSPEVLETAEKFMAAFNGAYRRRVRTVSPEIVRRVAERLKEYAPWQIIATPILSAAPRQAAGRVDPNDLDSTHDDEEAFRKQVMPEWCMRDGKHPRIGPDGKTYGATHWIERELQRADRTELTPRLTRLARELGIADELAKIGVKLLEEEG